MKSLVISFEVLTCIYYYYCNKQPVCCDALLARMQSGRWNVCRGLLYVWG